MKEESNKTKEQFIKENEKLKAQVAELVRTDSKRKKADETIHQYEHIVSSSTDMLALLDKRFSYLAANKSYLEAFDLSPDQLIGKTVSEVFGEEFFNNVIKPNAVSCIEGIEVNYQDWFDFPVYGRKYMDITYYPYYGKDNKIKGFVVNGRDITEHNKAENTLKESEEAFQTLLNNLNSGVVVHAPNTSIKYVNSTACKLLGLSEDQMMGKKAIDPQWKFLRDDNSDMPLDEYPVNLVLSTNQPIRNQIVGVNHPNTDDVTWVLVNGYTTLDNSGQINQVIINFDDITDLHLAEGTLRESEEKLVQAQYIAKMGNFTWNIQTGEVSWSAGMHKLLKYDINEEINYAKVNKDIHHPDDLERVTKWLMDSIASGNKELKPNEYRLECKTGEIIYVQTNGTIEYKNGEAIQLFGTCTDITERKQAEEKISHLGRIFEDSLNEIFLFDSDTLNFTLVNKAAQDNLGYSMEELKKMTPLSFKPEFTAESFAKLVEPLRKGEKEKIVFETVHLRKGQTLYNVEVHLQLLHFETESVFAAIIMDITDRKLAEENLLVKDQVFEFSLSAISTSGIDGLITHVNAAFLELWGYDSLEDVIGHSIQYFFVNPDEALPILESLSKTDKWNGEYLAKRKDGSTFIAQSLATVIRNKKGELTGYQSSVIDITEGKLAEEELVKHRDTLEETVKERTKELEEKNKKLDDAMKVFVGREQKIRDLEVRLRAFEGE